LVLPVVTTIVSIAHRPRRYPSPLVLPVVATIVSIAPPSILPIVFGIARRRKYCPSLEVLLNVNIVLPIVFGTAHCCNHLQYCLSSIWFIVFGIAHRQ
jgi:hypothetical protein